MKRLLAIVLAVLMMLTMFASCTKEEMPENTEQGTDEQTGLGDETNAPNTDKPADGTDKPTDGTDKPADGTDKPADGTDKPADGTDKPADGTDKPADGTDTPAAGVKPVLNGTTVTFGSYPQTKVTDATLIATLSTKGIAVEKDGKFTKTVEEGGSKYFGVSDTSSGEYEWFKFEDIKWTVLAEENGAKLILCDKIMDASAFDSEDNDYSKSDIRDFLNKTFLGTAFAANQLSYIVDSTVDNSATSTGYSNPTYYSENTTDKVFLLSRADIKVESYGFASTGVADASRQKMATDYAVSRIDSYDASFGAWWWVRTPGTTATVAHRIKIDGSIHSSDVNATVGGVLPAMWIKF